MTGRLTAVNRRLNNLSRQVSSNTGTLIHRTLLIKHVSCPEGKSQFDQVILNSSTRLTNSLQAVPFFDPATNAIVTANPTLNSFQQGYRVASTSSKVVITNNSIAGTRIRVGVLVPREDTSQGPTSSFTSGCTDIGISDDDPLVRLSDSQVLTDLWKFQPGTYKEMTLSPGAKYETTISAGGFLFNLATLDADDLTYRKDYKAQVLVVQTLGNVMHSVGASSEINYGECSLDITALTSRVFKYAAGADIRRVAFLDTERTTMTSGIQANQPSATRQNFA